MKTNENHSKSVLLLESYTKPYNSLKYIKSTQIHINPYEPMKIDATPYRFIQIVEIHEMHNNSIKVMTYIQIHYKKTHEHLDKFMKSMRIIQIYTIILNSIPIHTNLYKSMENPYKSMKIYTRSVKSIQIHTNPSELHSAPSGRQHASAFV